MIRLPPFSLFLFSPYEQSMLRDTYAIPSCGHASRWHPCHSPLFFAAFPFPPFLFFSLHVKRSQCSRSNPARQDSPPPLFLPPLLFLFFFFFLFFGKMMKLLFPRSRTGRMSLFPFPPLFLFSLFFFLLQRREIELLSDFSGVMRRKMPVLSCFFFAELPSLPPLLLSPLFFFPLPIEGSEQLFGEQWSCWCNSLIPSNHSPGGDGIFSPSSSFFLFPPPPSPPFSLFFLFSLKSRDSRRTKNRSARWSPLFPLSPFLFSFPESIENLEDEERNEDALWVTPRCWWLLSFPPISFFFPPPPTSFFFSPFHKRNPEHERLRQWQARLTNLNSFLSAGPLSVSFPLFSFFFMRCQTSRDKEGHSPGKVTHAFFVFLLLFPPPFSFSPQK